GDRCLPGRHVRGRRRPPAAPRAGRAALPRRAQRRGAHRARGRDAGASGADRGRWRSGGIRRMSAGAFVEYKDATVRASSGRTILDALTLAVPEGETLALIGRSGSGKTTALRLVNALVVPTRGTVHVAGKSTTNWDPIQLRRRTGYVIQEIGLLPHLTVADNAGIVAELEGWDAARRQARVAELLELVGLPAAEYGGRYPHELSGGQRQ